MGRYSVGLTAQLADLAGVTAGRRALDVGCGPGALTRELVARLGSDRVAAADPSEPFVAAARERNPGVDVRLAAAEALPFDDDAFDAALAQLVVHFMKDPVAGLREMARVTRPGGVVAACVWDHAGGQGPARRVLGGRARARRHGARRIRSRGRARGPPRRAVRRGRAPGDRADRASPRASSIRASRSGGSRSRSGSGRPAPTCRRSRPTARPAARAVPVAAPRAAVHRDRARVGGSRDAPESPTARAGGRRAPSRGRRRPASSTTCSSGSRSGRRTPSRSAGQGTP